MWDHARISSVSKRELWNMSRVWKNDISGHGENVDARGAWSEAGEGCHSHTVWVGQSFVRCCVWRRSDRNVRGERSGIERCHRQHWRWPRWWQRCRCAARCLIHDDGRRQGPTAIAQHSRGRAAPARQSDGCGSARACSPAPYSTTVRCAGISDCRGALMYLVYTFSHDGCSNSRCLGSRSLLAACQRGSEAVWPVWALGPTCARLRRTRTQVCFVRQVELHRLARLLLGCVALIGRQLSSALRPARSRRAPRRAA